MSQNNPVSTNLLNHYLENSNELVHSDTIVIGFKYYRDIMSEGGKVEGCDQPIFILSLKENEPDKLIGIPYKISNSIPSNEIHFMQGGKLICRLEVVDGG